MSDISVADYRIVQDNSKPFESTTIIDDTNGTATVVEGAEVVRTMAVSYATPILQHLYIPSSASTTLLVNNIPSRSETHNINKIRVISSSASTKYTAKPTDCGQTLFMISKIPNEDVTQLRSDDELTSLTWLQNSNLLQATPLSHVKISPTVRSSSETIKKEPKKMSKTIVEMPPHRPRDADVESPTSDFTEESADLTEPEVTVDTTSNVLHTQERSMYNPHLNPEAKPPYSFSSLIFMAIEDCKEKALPVKDIYTWVTERFPFYKNAPNGWKNSVRHNLSLNKCFKKVDKMPNLGKGSLWMVDPEFRQNLVAALSKTSCPTGTKNVYLYGAAGNPRRHIEHLESLKKEEINRQAKENVRRECPPEPVKHQLPNPRLFPHLAKHLDDVYADDSKETADAAAIMLHMKHGVGFERYKPVRKRKQCHQELVDPNNVFISTSPSIDHAYSSAKRSRLSDKSSSSGIDEAFSDESFDSEDTKDGTEVLRSLASLATSSELRRELESNPLFHLQSLETLHPDITKKRKKLKTNNNNNNLITVNQNLEDYL